MDAAVGVVLDRGRQAGRRAEDAHRGQVVEDEVAAVDRARHARDADVDHPPGRLDPRQGRGGHLVVVGAVDDRVVGHWRRIVGRPVAGGAEARGEFLAARPQRPDVDLGAHRPGEGGRQQPDGARSADQDPLPGPA